MALLLSDQIEEMTKECVALAQIHTELTALFSIDLKEEYFQTERKKNEELKEILTMMYQVLGLAVVQQYIIQTQKEV